MDEPQKAGRAWRDSTIAPSAPPLHAELRGYAEYVELRGYAEYAERRGYAEYAQGVW